MSVELIETAKRNAQHYICVSELSTPDKLAAMNCVDVLHDEIVRLRGEVDELAPQLDAMTAGYERMTAYAISHKGSLVYMSESARAAYSDVVVERDAALASIAPAEEKGDAYVSLCSAHQSQHRDPNCHICNPSVTPQPADGEAVACGRVEIRGVTADDPGYVHLVGDYMQLNRARQAGHGALLYTTPPAAQVQHEAVAFVPWHNDHGYVWSGAVPAVGSAPPASAVEARPPQYGWEFRLLFLGAVAAHPSACELGAASGWRVMRSGSGRPRDTWEIYDPSGNGGMVSNLDVKDWIVRELLDALALQHRGDSRGGEAS